MNLTPAMEDYLEAVLIVAKKQVEVRSVDIARQLNVSKPSVWRGRIAWLIRFILAPVRLPLSAVKSFHR